MLAKADVFVQNLKPGAIAKLGFPLDQIRREHPRLVVCSISGYGSLLAQHPHLRRIAVVTPSGLVSCPAPAARCAGERRRYGRVPALGEHTAGIRAEFMLKEKQPGPARKKP
jgi:crotonobetainyl-CoA:carnitine CoA-transferase CaiB-like acyl-CoA transferase